MARKIEQKAVADGRFCAVSESNAGAYAHAGRRERGDGGRAGHGARLEGGGRGELDDRGERNQEAKHGDESVDQKAGTGQGKSWARRWRRRSSPDRKAKARA